MVYPGMASSYTFATIRFRPQKEREKEEKIQKEDIQKEALIFKLSSICYDV